MNEHCVFCGSEAEQNHHVKYEPEMVVPVCISCHVKIHEHGVGGNGDKKKKEKELLMPRYLELTASLPPYIITKLDNEVVGNVICPNGCKMGWQLCYSKMQDSFFLRCPNCGYDEIVEILRKKGEANAKSS